jgi:hypothetical protein
MKKLFFSILLLVGCDKNPPPCRVKYCYDIVQPEQRNTFDDCACADVVDGGVYVPSR